MKCPYCGSEESKVVDKRETDDLVSNRRRRECLKCSKRFTTYERIERIELNVVKKDGRREAFNREKLISGITKACEKRPVGREKIEAIVNEIESELLQRKETEIPSREIGELVMQRLKKLDEVAFIRFASVYKTFTDVAEFERELKNLKVVEEKSSGDSTDILLQVATHAAGSTIGWRRSRITEALMKEADLSKDNAEEIAQSVEKKVFASGIKTISVSLIRELVDNELFVRGYEKKLEKQGLIGMPSYNLNQLIYNMS
ncbi:transcriptional regulator NrdR, partial [Candidatus Micrarchaeota archaeon]|nr:transcriptional regulator NrdR [Candidatus Micrarchaeota archaeon]